MDEHILKVTSKMLTGGLSGREQEKKEFMVIQELCGANALEDVSQLLDALCASGTIPFIPALFGQWETGNEETKMLSGIAIDLIKARARTRGSILPDEYFTANIGSPAGMAT